ncbi:MAG: hypothetical protein KUG78_06480, partial [Kangiellaceae bacterium]|nr:hypothetical protein [Kangiellaceae bacterium]
QLKAVESIHPRSIRLYGELWLDLVQNWKAKEATPIARVLNPRDVPQLKQLSNELETIVKNSAQKLDIPVALLMSKRVIRKLAFSFLTDESTPALWNGWRRKLLADQIAAKKKQFVNS